MGVLSMELFRQQAFPGSRRRWPKLSILALAVWLTAAPAAADESQRNELDRGSPQAAMRGYLEASRAGDYERAAAYLDLRRLPPAMRSKRGPDLARKLKIALDRTLWVELDNLSDLPEGDRDDGLPPRRDLVGTIDTTRGPVPIFVERINLPSETSIWQIASATVAHIPALDEEFGYGRLGEHLPPIFFEVKFLEIQLWQWLGLFGLVALAAATSWVVTVIITRVARPMVTRAAGNGRLSRAVAAPLCLAIAIALFSTGSCSLGLAVPVYAFLGAVQSALVIVAVAWFLLRVVDAAAQTVVERLTARGQAVALSVVPLGKRTLQVVVTGLATVAVLQNLGINVTGILTGLGLGGLAVALAAQKTVENLFGGVTLIADQPVRVGDFCRFGDKVGTVEEVGLRSTRVRTLERTVVTIPNADFSAMQLENFSQRDRIWFHTTLGLRYETTADQLRCVLIELKTLLVAHPKVHTDPARVRFVGFGAYSLDIEIFAYVKTNNYDEFLAVQEDLLLRIMDVVATSGSSFAFPSQTIYAGVDAGLEEKKGEAAAARVRQWRDANDLWLPHAPPQQLAALAGTLDYPPKGSATGI